MTSQLSVSLPWIFRFTVVLLAISGCAPSGVPTTAPSRDIAPSAAPSATISPTQSPLPATQPQRATATLIPSSTSATAFTPSPVPTSACQTGRTTLSIVDQGVTFELGGPIEEPVAAYLNNRGTVRGLVATLDTLCGALLGRGPSLPVLAKAASTDVTGDGAADVVVAVTVPYGDGLGEAHVIAFVRTESGFVPHTLFRRAGAGSDAEGLYEGGGSSLLKILDMNSDGISEVPFAVHWASHTEFYIGEWVGDSFQSLVDLFHPLELTPVPYITTSPATGEISDLDGDGTRELVIEGRMPGDLPIFPARFRHQQVWGWDGERFSLRSTSITSMPTYRIEAIIFGELAAGWSFTDLRSSIEMFQGAVFDLSLKPGSPGRRAELSTAAENAQEAERLAAFGRFWIMMSLAYLGDYDAAQTAFQGLLGKFAEGTPGYPYALMAREFWNAYEAERLAIDGCEAAKKYALIHSNEILDPLGPDYYGAEYVLELFSPESCYAYFPGP